MSTAKKFGKYLYKMNPLEKTLSFIGLLLCLVFGFTLICNLTIIIKGALYPEEPPSVLGTVPMVVLSGSMSGDAEDHIEIGDLIFVGRVEPEELKEGDVIAFMSGKTIITHRIVRIEGGEAGLQFITKGDANNAEDQVPVPEDKLVGIYKARIPEVGNFVLFMQTPGGMFLFVGLPLMAFIVYDIIRRQRFMKRERQRNDDMKAEISRLRREAIERESK